ncbi:MAG: DinB family protein [Crocinitomicaceae bacterium]
MKVSNKELIKELRDITNSVIIETEKLNSMSEKALQTKANSESWSALECIEHLNRYSMFYVPEINKVMADSTKKSSQVFRSGILGNYFAKSMQVKPKLNKMKTFKDMNPNQSQIDKSVIDSFLKYQEQTLEILDIAVSQNLTKLKTGITISNLIKLRLGDTLRVVIYHNQRHIAQALKAVNNIVV